MTDTTTNCLVNIQSIAVYGGAGVASQIGDLKRGGEIVVCTPGRMIDILSSNKGNILSTKTTTIKIILLFQFPGCLFYFMMSFCSLTPTYKLPICCVSHIWSWTKLTGCLIWDLNLKLCASSTTFVLTDKR
jgi:hypothetical protein